MGSFPFVGPEVEEIAGLRREADGFGWRRMVVFHGYDLSGILPRLFERGLDWLAVGLGILIAQTAVAAVRWHSILRSLRLAMPLWAVVRIFYVMAF